MIEPEMLTPPPSSKKLKADLGLSSTQQNYFTKELRTKLMSKNAEMGLPRRAKMQQYYFAFDIDGTLRSNTVDQNRPPVANEDIRTLLVILRRAFKNVKIIVWSGGGELYARQVGAALGLDKYVSHYMSKSEYEEHWVDKSIIAVDDIQDTALGNVANLIVRMK